MKHHIPIVAVTLTVCARILLAAGDKPGASVTDPAAAGEYFLNFKQHYDIGFWGICADGSGMVRPLTARKMVETFKGYHLDQALATFAATDNEPAGKRFVWVVPGWVLTQMLDQPPERKQRVVELLKRGQLDLLANPFSTDTEALDLETFVRGLGFSSRIARANDLLLPVAVNMTDVPEHTFATATVFHHAGIKFFRTGCNPCSTSPYLPSLFWWEGPDGSRTLTMYSPGRYGTNSGPPKGWPSKSWLWLFMRGDNTGCQNAAQFRNIMGQATKARPTARTGRIEDFARAVLAENPKLPVVKQDASDTWIHGIMAMPVETGIARTVRPRIVALEALDTLLGQWKVGPPSAARTVADAYEKSLLFGEHTWGSWLGDGRDQWKYGEEFDLAWNAGFYRDVEATYQEHGDYIRAAQALIEPALTERMAALGRAVNVPGKRIVVFNPLPWTRDAIVETTASPGLTGRSLRLRDAATRNRVNASIDGQTIRFTATGMPPLGYRAYAVEEGASGAEMPANLKADAAAGILENAFLRITLDPARGTIASIVDKQSNRELIDRHSKYGFGQYLFEQFTGDDVRNYRKAYGKWNPAALCKQNLPTATQLPPVSASPEQFALSVTNNGITATATLTAEPTPAIGHAIILKITLHHDTPCADLEWSITGKRPDLRPEAGWLCLPVNAANPEFRLSRMLGIVNPATDICRNSNFDVFCLDAGLTVHDQDSAGLGICPVNAPLVSLGAPGLMKFSGAWSPREPVVFVNLFNNVWGCNFRQWIDGGWSSRIRIWPTHGNDDEKNLITPGREAQVACPSAMVDAPAGTLPPQQAGITLSRNGVAVTAFGTNPDGSGTLLRLWEQAGTGGELTVTGLHAETVTPVNLRGEKTGKPIAIRSGKLTINLPAYAPASFVLE